MSLYDRLGLDPSASLTDIRKMYMIMAKRLHPDKNRSPTAAEEFRKIHEAYAVLHDPKMKAVYDAHGKVTIEIVDIPSFASITKEDIQEFMKTYRYSPQEREDVLRYVQQFHGNLEMVIKYVPFAAAGDKARFRRMMGASELDEKNGTSIPEGRHHGR